MGDETAVVRQKVEALEGVSRTWFEWEIAPGNEGPTKTLVVEVDMDTDPNSTAFDSSALDDIRDTIIEALTRHTTMVVSHARIVPKR